MLIVFTGVDDNRIKILSTIARVSGGTYEPILERTRQWRENRGQNFSRSDKERFLENYLTPLLRCGKPPRIEDERWLLKCLSNDQTAFTGFTSLVDIVEDGLLGYDGRVTLLPKAAFAEPFVLRRIDEQKQQRLMDVQRQIQSLDSTRIDEINFLLTEAEALTPTVEQRAKGKAPIFFYSVTDKPFLLPRALFERMERATKVLCDGLSEIAQKFQQSLEEALFSASLGGRERQFFTGSIDFLVSGNTIYVIDIGSPAVGYVADIVFASEALGRNAEIGVEALAQAAGNEIVVYQGNSRNLGFFALENKVLVDGLRGRGINVTEEEGWREVALNGIKYPLASYDYLTRNQPLRNKIIQAMQWRLEDFGVNLPNSVVTYPERGDLQQWEEQVRLGDDYGLVVKKKVFFTEYDERGAGYFKPLVTPLWSPELNDDFRRSTLFEQFIPSFVDVEVAGERTGKRCYEIRLYYCVEGEQ
ncbi:MAG: hypothetical protein AABX37_03625 [Nanoarchaeota archaeon]